MIESVHAILLVDGRYALQLRDNDPAIAGPGLWGMFGGAIEPGESPVEALGREVHEELSIRLRDSRLFWLVEGVSEFSPTRKRWWVFEADVSDQWESHVLHEGQAARVFTFSQTTGVPMARITREVLTCHFETVRSQRGGGKPPRRIP